MACFELLRKQLDSAGLCIAPNKIQTTTPVQYLGTVGTASLSNPRKSKLEGIKFLLYMIYINYWETLIGYI